MDKKPAPKHIVISIHDNKFWTYQTIGTTGNIYYLAGSNYGDYGAETFWTMYRGRPYHVTGHFERLDNGQFRLYQSDLFATPKDSFTRLVRNVDKGWAYLHEEILNALEDGWTDEMIAESLKINWYNHIIDKAIEHDKIAVELTEKQEQLSIAHDNLIKLNNQYREMYRENALYEISGNKSVF